MFSYSSHVRAVKRIWMCVCVCVYINVCVGLYGFGGVAYRAHASDPTESSSSRPTVEALRCFLGTLTCLTQGLMPWDSLSSLIAPSLEPRIRPICRSEKPSCLTLSSSSLGTLAPLQETMTTYGDEYTVSTFSTRLIQRHSKTCNTSSPILRLIAVLQRNLHTVWNLTSFAVEQLQCLYIWIWYWSH